MEGKKRMKKYRNARNTFTYPGGARTWRMGADEATASRWAGLRPSRMESMACPMPLGNNQWADLIARALVRRAKTRHHVTCPSTTYKK